jgi:hypothetical protein
LRNHGQVFGPLDPICFSAATVRRRSVALPSLFPRPRSRRRDLTGRPLSSPVWQPLDRPRALPQSVGMTVASRGAIKRRNLPAVLPLPSLACLRFRQTVSPLLFFLSLASFGQPTTSPFRLLLRPLAEQAG